ncbi:hypothetical protein TNCV_2029271 [Trichonephila clavipes]|nr:hypothetical protein TNCV_2029271 [Trichonephila clavipes]
MWTDQIKLGKEEVRLKWIDCLENTINARNWKSQKSRLENFLWAALMWTDQIVLGKEEVQSSSGSIVSKKTINARNWKSQRLEVKVKTCKLPLFPVLFGLSTSVRPQEVSRLKWIDCLENRQCQVLKKSKVKT